MDFPSTIETLPPGFLTKPPGDCRFCGAPPRNTTAGTPVFRVVADTLTAIQRNPDADHAEAIADTIATLWDGIDYVGATHAAVTEHDHPSDCPKCGTRCAPYDDQPDAGEWTATYVCRAEGCDAAWTEDWDRHLPASG